MKKLTRPHGCSLPLPGLIHLVLPSAVMQYRWRLARLRSRTLTLFIQLPGPVTPMKMPGSLPYSQYDMMVGDGLGDNWHRTPGNKMATKLSAAPSWPPG